MNDLVIEDTVMPSRRLRAHANRHGEVDINLSSNGRVPITISITKDEAISLMAWLSEVTR